MRVKEKNKHFIQNNYFHTSSSEEESSEDSMNSLLLNFEGEMDDGFAGFDDFESASLIGFDFDDDEDFEGVVDASLFCSWVYLAIAIL